MNITTRSCELKDEDGSATFEPGTIEIALEPKCATYHQSGLDASMNGCQYIEVSKRFVPFLNLDVQVWEVAWFAIEIHHETRNRLAEPLVREYDLENTQELRLGYLHGLKSEPHGEYMVVSTARRPPRALACL